MEENNEVDVMAGGGADEVTEVTAEASSELESLAASFIEDIPEDMRSLIPGLPPVEQIKWIREAQKKGLFAKKAPESGPDAKRPSTKKPQDFGNLGTKEKIAMGYAK